MESIEGEEVKGYWIIGDLICRDCIDKAEVKGIGKENILIEFNMDEGVDYICCRCKRRI